MSFRRGVLVGLPVAAALAVALGLAGAARSESSASPSIAAIYSVTIGVKGGASSSDSGTDLKDQMATVHTSHSFSMDGTIATAMIAGGPLKRGIPQDGAGYTRSWVKGTWTAQGTKWVDPANNVTAPFTCSGPIVTHVTPQMSLSWKRSGAVVKFKLAAVQQELYWNGRESCPSGVSGDPVYGYSPVVYETTFSIPVSSVGHKTITVQVAGPLLAARKQMIHNCESVGVKGCSMAWHGVVRFTLKRLFQYP